MPPQPPPPPPAKRTSVSDSDTVFPGLPVRTSSSRSMMSSSSASSCSELESAAGSHKSAAGRRQALRPPRLTPPAQVGRRRPARPAHSHAAFQCPNVGLHRQQRAGRPLAAVGAVHPPRFCLAPRGVTPASGLEGLTTGCSHRDCAARLTIVPLLLPAAEMVTQPGRRGCCWLLARQGEGNAQREWYAGRLEGPKRAGNTVLRYIQGGEA